MPKQRQRISGRMKGMHMRRDHLRASCRCAASRSCCSTPSMRSRPCFWRCFVVMTMLAATSASAFASSLRDARVAA